MAYHKKEHGTARGIRPVLMEALPHYLWPVDNPAESHRRGCDAAESAIEP